MSHLRRAHPGGKLTVPEQHMLRIARETLKMSDAMVKVMGGMTKEKARDTIHDLTGRIALNPRQRSRSRGKPRIKRSRAMRSITRRGKPVTRAVWRRSGFRRNGRTVTPPYRVEWVTRGAYRMTASAWETRFNGRPTLSNLERYVTHMRRSMGPGGVNESAKVDIIGARLVRQKDGTVVAQVGFSSSNPRHRHRSNPTLAIVGANPRGGRRIGIVVGQLRYHRDHGKFPGWYKHTFKAKSRATLYAMPDGSLRISSGGR